MKHTAGPWKHSTYEGGWDCVRDDQSAVICRLVQNNPANATLIAAAPDLLRACKMAREIVNAYYVLEGLDDTARAANLKEIDAAIAKAAP